MELNISGVNPEPDGGKILNRFGCMYPPIYRISIFAKVSAKMRRVSKKKIKSKLSKMKKPSSFPIEKTWITIYNNSNINMYNNGKNFFFNMNIFNIFLEGVFFIFPSSPNDTPMSRFFFLFPPIADLELLFPVFALYSFSCPIPLLHRRPSRWWGKWSRRQPERIHPYAYRVASNRGGYAWRWYFCVNGGVCVLAGDGGWGRDEKKLIEIPQEIKTPTYC